MMMVHLSVILLKCRQDADYPVVGPESVDLIDVSPQQIASVSAGLIPFLEHDDGHRALMGCNMDCVRQFHCFIMMHLLLVRS